MAHRSRSGWRSYSLAGRRSRSWPRTLDYASTCRSGSPARSAVWTGIRLWGQYRRNGEGGTSLTEKTDSGFRGGVQSRSRTGSRSTSPMMTACASATRPSIRRCSSRVAARSSESSSSVCVPEGRCACHRHGPSGCRGLTSPADVLISERPAEAEDRAIPGHHDGDLAIGTNRSASGTVVERATGLTTLAHLPREEGWLEQPIVKNGPSLSGYGEMSMNRTLAKAMATLPAELKRFLTWERGKGMSAHAQFAIDIGLKVYFADPHSPWQRGTNENTNGLLRQYFSKGTGLSRWSSDDLVAHENVSAGALRPKRSTSTYTYYNQVVLRRPIESASNPGGFI